MTGVTHLAVAVTASSFILGPDIGSMAVSALSSLMPDIDHPHSQIGKKIPLLPDLLNLFFGHRTFTHSLLGLIVVSVFLYFQAPLWGKAWLIGYGSHLLLDLMTPSGAPLFWPLPKNFSLGIARTGGVIDLSLLVTLILFNCFTPWGKTIWKTMWSQIVNSLGILL